MTNDYDLAFFDELHTVVFCMILIVPPSATALSFEARVYGHGSWTCLAGFFAILHEEKSIVLTNPVNPPYKQLVYHTTIYERSPKIKKKLMYI